jgi:hypothetical protein
MTAAREAEARYRGKGSGPVRALEGIPVGVQLVGRPYADRSGPAQPPSWSVSRGTGVFPYGMSWRPVSRYVA